MQTPLSDDPIEVNSELGRRLDALLDDLIRLSLQPGNDEEENKAVSDRIDAVHDEAMGLYRDLNRCEYRHEALAPLVDRFGPLRLRADDLIAAHGPIRRDLPGPFGLMGQELERLIGLCRQEIHSDEADESRDNTVEELYHAVADLNDDVIWSGLRHRQEDLPDLQARFASVRARGIALYP